MKRWLKRAYRQHAQSRNSNSPADLSVAWGWSARRQGAGVPTVPTVRMRPARGTWHHAITMPPGTSGGHQHAIEELFELLGALGNLAVARAVVVAASEQLVGDVQGGQHGQAHRIGRGRRLAGGVHLLVDVGRQPRDVLGIELRADRILLSADLDRNDGTFSH